MPKNSRTVYNFLFNYEWLDKEFFNQLDADSTKKERTSEEITTKKVAKIITRVARDSPFIYEVRTSPPNSKHIVLKYRISSEKKMCE